MVAIFPEIHHMALDSCESRDIPNYYPVILPGTGIKSRKPLSIASYLGLPSTITLNRLKYMLIPSLSRP
jgi:hypothetical protein